MKAYIELFLIGGTTFIIMAMLLANANKNDKIIRAQANDYVAKPYIIDGE